MTQKIWLINFQIKLIEKFFINGKSRIVLNSWCQKLYAHELVDGFMVFFKGLESAGIGTATGWRIVFLIACCFSFGIPAIIYFALAIILPYEKLNKK